MNGRTLQVTFIGVLATLCFILLVLTVLLCFKQIDLNLYKEIITMLGIPTLIGMIVQAFIHADFNKDGIPDHQQITRGNGNGKENGSIGGDAVAVDPGAGGIQP